MCRDLDDNKYLDCAVQGHAVLVVSGDKDLLSLKLIGDIPIVTARKALNEIEGVAVQRLTAHDAAELQFIWVSSTSTKRPSRSIANPPRPARLRQEAGGVRQYHSVSPGFSWEVNVSQSA